MMTTVAKRAERGKFITFEGLDGCGKTTQLEKLAAVLCGQGIDVVTTREPGGTEIGERIRAVLLDSRTAGLDAHAEMALMFASRAQLIAQVILPALEAGQWVLCDRFTDSTEAYQGGGRQLGSEAVLRLHQVLCRGLWPDLTILMDTDASASVARARRRNKATAQAEVRRPRILPHRAVSPTRTASRKRVTRSLSACAMDFLRLHAANRSVSCRWTRGLRWRWCIGRSCELCGKDWVKFEREKDSLEKHA